MCSVRGDRMGGAGVPELRGEHLESEREAPATAGAEASGPKGAKGKRAAAARGERGAESASTLRDRERANATGERDRRILWRVSVTGKPRVYQ